MAFEVLELAYQLVASCKEILKKLKEQDRDLERQLRKALSGVPAGFAEGNWRGGRDRPYLFGTSAGSANEAGIHLRTAEAFGYVTIEEIAPPLALIDRVLAMSWRLTHRRWCRSGTDRRPASDGGRRGARARARSSP